MGKFADELMTKFPDDDEPKLSDFKKHSIAYAIQWRFEESVKPGARVLGESIDYTLSWMQKEPIAAKIIPDLKPGDIVNFARSRIAEGVKPCTVNHDMTCLRGTIRQYIGANDLPVAWLDVFAKAKYLLEKEQLVGKSQPRDRLPTLEELNLFRAYFAKQNEHPLCITDMVLVLDGLLLTGRRVSELVRTERQHVNVKDKTYWVYDLKNSKGKGYHGEAALIEGAWELFEQRLAVIPNEPNARLFPFKGKTCTQRFTKAKKVLQKERPDLFKGLRMHDMRAECCVRLLDKGYSPLQVTKGVSLHLDIKTMTTRYARIKAIDLHKGPIGARVMEQRTSP